MNKIKNISIIIFLLLVINQINAQNDSINSKIENVFLYKATDSIPSFDLDSVYVLPKMRFNNNKELKRYRWFRRKVYKVYPFAKLFGKNLLKLEKRLAGMESKRKKRRYIRIIQKWIKKEFEPQLKQLTQTEGRILSKLIHRQTSKTTYYYLKEYKSGWSAFWYQQIAKLNHINLKNTFNPKEIKEDYWIEYILQHAFQEEILEYTPNKLGLDFLSLKNKWQPKYIPKAKKGEGKLPKNNTVNKKILNKSTLKKLQ